MAHGICCLGVGKLSIRCGGWPCPPFCGAPRHLHGL